MIVSTYVRFVSVAVPSPEYVVQEDEYGLCDVRKGI